MRKLVFLLSILQIGCVPALLLDRHPEDFEASSNSTCEWSETLHEWTGCSTNDIEYYSKDYYSFGKEHECCTTKHLGECFPDGTIFVEINDEYAYIKCSDKERIKEIADSIHTILVEDSIKAYKDSILAYETRIKEIRDSYIRDSIQAYNDSVECYHWILPLAKKINESEEDMRTYLKENKRFSCESIAEAYKTRIKEIRDSIQVYNDSVAWTRDSIIELEECFTRVRPLSKKTNEKEKDFKEYLYLTFDRYTRCDWIENKYREIIQYKQDSIQAYKDSVKAYKKCYNTILPFAKQIKETERKMKAYLDDNLKRYSCESLIEIYKERIKEIADSIQEYKDSVTAYKTRHKYDFHKISTKRIGGILVKKDHVRYGSDEYVRFYIYEDIEGNGDTRIIMRDNKCEADDDWNDDCYIDDDYIDPEVDIFYKGEKIATVNLDRYDYKRLQQPSVCHVDDSTINDIQACVRKFHKANR